MGKKKQLLQPINLRDDQEKIEDTDHLKKVRMGYREKIKVNCCVRCKFCIPWGFRHWCLQGEKLYLTQLFCGCDEWEKDE